MRMRNKKHLAERLERCADVTVENPGEYKGRWRELFGDDGELHIEIGCGKGAFIEQLAEKHPDVNYIAMEKTSNVIVMAMEKIKNKGLKNVRFVMENAVNITEYFADGECDRIYLNFSDPLPKKGYMKKRLTHPKYLAMYKTILKENGDIHQKTDNKGLFEFSLNSYADEGFKLKNITFDLHNSGFEGNIMTEYERKFSEEGFPIYRVEAINVSKNK